MPEAADHHDDDDLIPEVVEHPIGPELDLHTFRPGEISSLIPEYFTECRKRGILRVRIIHGKGSGTLRTGVHQLLARLPEVQQWIWPADGTSGSWGATWVILKA
ncbi:MAG: Smr/MutS family protein [Prosthecobacter sp.]